MYSEIFLLLSLPIVISKLVFTNLTLQIIYTLGDSQLLNFYNSLPSAKKFLHHMIMLNSEYSSNFSKRVVPLKEAFPTPPDCSGLLLSLRVFVPSCCLLCIITTPTLTPKTSPHKNISVPQTVPQNSAE